MAPDHSDQDDTPPRHTTFHDLPGELRNRIYFMSGCLDRRINREDIQAGRIRTVTGDRLPDCSKMPPRFPFYMPQYCQYTEEKVVQAPRAFLVVSKIEEAKPQIPSRRYVRSCQCILPAQSNRETLRLPDLTKVSKQVREETLPIFLGNHPFVFLLMGEDTDKEEKEIMDWLDTIGPISAGFLRDIEVVYSSKQMLRYIDGDFSNKLQQRGVKIDEGVMKTRRLKYPFKATKEFALRQLELRE